MGCAKMPMSQCFLKSMDFLCKEQKAGVQWKLPRIALRWCSARELTMLQHGKGEGKCEG